MDRSREEVKEVYPRDEKNAYKTQPPPTTRAATPRGRTKLLLNPFQCSEFFSFSLTSFILFSKFSCLSFRSFFLWWTPSSSSGLKIEERFFHRVICTNNWDRLHKQATNNQLVYCVRLFSHKSSDMNIKEIEIQFSLYESSEDWGMYSLLRSIINHFNTRLF